MHAKFSTNALPGLAEKLKSARNAVGISTRLAAERAGARMRLSHATIANYEKGRSTPSLDVLAVLASVYGRPINWFLESGETLSGVRYRNLTSRVRLGERQQYEANSQKWLEAYVRLERHLGSPLEAESVIPDIGGVSEDEAAERIRSALGVKKGEPVPSMARAMEQFGIRAIELPTEAAIDGLAARFGSEFVVVLNPDTVNDRCRLNAAHETVHIATGDCESGLPSSKDDERRAFNIASRILLPEAQLKKAFEGRSLVRLVAFKEQFGISLAAMIYRAEHASIISKGEAKWLWIEFSRRGWRRKEPGYVRPDRAVRFEDMLDSAIAEKRIPGWGEAGKILGVSEEELRQRNKMALGLTSDIGDDEEGGDDEPTTIRLVR